MSPVGEEETGANKLKPAIVIIVVEEEDGNDDDDGDDNDNDDDKWFGNSEISGVCDDGLFLKNRPIIPGDGEAEVEEEKDCAIS